MLLRRVVPTATRTSTIRLTAGSAHVQPLYVRGLGTTLPRLTNARTDRRPQVPLASSSDTSSYGSTLTSGSTIERKSRWIPPTDRSSFPIRYEGRRLFSSSSVGRTNAVTDDQPQLAPPGEGAKTQQVGQIEPRLSLTFTCTANECGHRSTHEFSRRSYEKGIVLVQCPSCKARHLIADHLGWFKESTEEGKLKTVEDLLRAKGEVIRRGRVNFDGDIEYDGDS